jgi:hypothetical protein
MRKLKVLFAISICLLFLASCASFVKNTYVTLNESKDLYTVAMTSVASLQAQKLITQAQRDEINKVAKIYKEAHNTAVDALATYKKTESAADKDKVIVALGEAAAKWAQVARLINTIKPGLVPATISK